ncbi:MAG: response regulator [Elusimicrobia bacterium]|nr:response regulator [Elusimicrobiota bacterium]
MAKILVVDDEPSVVMLMRFVLEKSGHVVSEAHNGLEALQVLGVDPQDAGADLPDLVLLDVMMPIMDGLATAEALRADARVSKVPILVVSAKGDMRGLFQEMPQVVGFFQKPFDPKLLREAIAKIAPAK